ncbi:MAG: DUF4199 domain-containing protein [Acidobacteriia bacterium]|nr:DUF4199 domain-containing protein [Terriglobia bacterium]
MKHVLTAGILIGVFCGLWQLLLGVTGWYKDPVMMNMFWVVILIQIGFLIWGLRRTAKEGKAYWAQVGLGTLMSLIAGVILFFVSFLFTSVLYPNYFSEMRAMREEALRISGRSPAEIKTMLDMVAGTQTSFFQAITGFAGTVVTGFVCSLLIGAFVRKKS